MSPDGGPDSLPSQAQIIGEINDAAGETGVIVCAAGSAPGDLHKLWVARDPAGKGYHVEYGYSCMGYEIPGGIGVKLAAPEREVYVLVGRRLVPDAAGRARDRGGAAGPDRDRARRQPRLRVDRRAVAVGRLGRVRDALPVRRERLACRSTRRRPMCCRSTSPPMPRASGAQVIRRKDDRRAARGARGRARRRRPRRGLHRGRPLRRACRATTAGGTCRSPRSQTRTACAPRASDTSETHAAQRQYLRSSR